MSGRTTSGKINILKNKTERSKTAALLKAARVWARKVFVKPSNRRGLAAYSYVSQDFGNRPAKTLSELRIEAYINERFQQRLQ